MKKRISNIDVFQAGKIQAVISFCLGLVAVPFILLMGLFGPGRSFLGAIVAAIFAPLLYAFIGFIGGLIISLVYNLVAGWTGGLEFTMTDVEPPAGLPGSYVPGQIQR